MERSAAGRILTTHTGSLPRPAELVQLLTRLDRDEATDEDRAAFPGLVESAVKDAVRRQVEAGIDIVNDGEQSKVSYATYVTQRVHGFGGTGQGLIMADYFDFPEFAASLGLDPSEMIAYPACVGDVKYRGLEAVDNDVINLRAGLDATAATDAFISCASPGVISLFLENQHYPDHESYLHALTEEMKVEYDALHAAGFIVQLDCPDLAAGRHTNYHDLSLDAWLDVIRVHIEAINIATRDIPPDRLRMHVCWGNYPAPHTRDVPLRDIVDVVIQARPAGLSFEAANPRHEHEWRVWEDVKLPDGKYLIPGVIDSTTNYVEHPELVCERITRLANLVGRENVVASSDCGYGTVSTYAIVHPEIVWAKFRALSEGAALATRQLWGRAG